MDKNNSNDETTTATPCPVCGKTQPPDSDPRMAKLTFEQLDAVAEAAVDGFTAADRLQYALDEMRGSTVGDAAKLASTMIESARTVLVAIGQTEPRGRHDHG